jgi:hypothetical protein
MKAAHIQKHLKPYFACLMLRRKSARTARLELELDGAENKIRFLEAYNKERGRQFISVDSATDKVQLCTCCMCGGRKAFIFYKQRKCTEELVKEKEKGKKEKKEKHKKIKETNGQWPGRLQAAKGQPSLNRA